MTAIKYVVIARSSELMRTRGRDRKRGEDVRHHVLLHLFVQQPLFCLANSKDLLLHLLLQSSIRCLTSRSIDKCSNLHSYSLNNFPTPFVSSYPSTVHIVIIPRAIVRSQLITIFHWSIPLFWSSSYLISMKLLIYVIFCHLMPMWWRLQTWPLAFHVASTRSIILLLLTPFSLAHPMYALFLHTCWLPPFSLCCRSYRNFNSCSKLSLAEDVTRAVARQRSRSSLKVRNIFMFYCNDSNLFYLCH